MKYLVLSFILSSLISTSGIAEEARPEAPVIQRGNIASATPFLVPQPKNIIWNDGVFRLGGDSIEIVAGPEDGIAVKELQCELAGKYQIDCSISLPDKEMRIPQIILLKEKKGSADQESYRLEVDTRKITITSSGQRGMFYGVQTLKQLIQRQDGMPVIPNCEIHDSPQFDFRGVLMVLTKCTANSRTMEGLKRIIDVQARLKQNVLIIEFGGNIQFERRKFPKKTKTAFTKTQVKELIEYARARHLEVIPAFQMLSHCVWILDDPRNAQFLEDPTTTSWGATWCPSNPEVYRFVEDILEETIELFRPRYCLVGLDEVGAVGKCEKCFGKVPSLLFLKTIRYLHDTLAAHGVKTIMWHDMLLPPGMGTANKVNGYQIIDQIPRDVIIAYWDYGVFDEKSRERLEYFTEKGFSVLGASFANPIGIQSLNTGLATNSKALGHIGTYWYEVVDWSDSRKISPKAWLAQVLGAQYAWNSAEPAIRDIQYDPLLIARRSYGPPAPIVEERDWVPVGLESVFNERISDEINSWPGYGKGNSLDDIYREKLIRGEIPFWLGDKDKDNVVLLKGAADCKLPAGPAVIPVQRRVDRLAFLHTCNIPYNRDLLEKWMSAATMPSVGRYRINYEDGSSFDIPLLYRWNIMDWNSKTGTFGGQIAYAGKTKDGFRFQLLRLDWKNPFPEKTVRNITFNSAGNNGMSPALFAVSAQFAQTDNKKHEGEK